MADEGGIWLSATTADESAEKQLQNLSTIRTSGELVRD